MFYPYYEALKTRLADQVAAIEDIQKFNDQYAGSNLKACVALIEFPDTMSDPYISKTRQRSSFGVTVHLVSKIMSDKDGYVPDDQYKTHDELADTVTAALKEHQLVYGGANLARPLQVTGYEEMPKIRGWLVTKIMLQTRE